MFPVTSLACECNPASSVDTLWRGAVKSIHEWLQSLGVDARKAVILLPQVRHLQLARQAWSEHVGGWLPSMETPQTLCAGWVAAPTLEVAGMTFDVAMDRLTALDLLRQASINRDTNPLALEHALASLVHTAHGIARAAFLVPPLLRAAHWQACREALLGGSGPAGRERALALLAMEWAAQQAPARTDALFFSDPQEARRVSAWAAVQVGGADPLAHAVLQSASQYQPCAWLDLDAALANLETAACIPVGAGELQVAVCIDFEEEAQRSAAQVLHHVSNHEVPVVVIAQDRVLVRRIQALLARQQVQIQDETGWKLSTTPAASVVMSWLRGLRPQAVLDEVLDALKLAPQCQLATQSLETTFRRRHWYRWEQVVPDQLPPSAAALWQELDKHKSRFLRMSSCLLTDWLACLREVMQVFGLHEVLSLDAAGVQVLAVLRLTKVDEFFEGWSRSLGPLEYAAWMGWVDQTLEHAAFMPEPVPSAAVVVTPLSHAVLRPFAAVVFAGADAKRWGVGDSLHPLLTPQQAQVFGLPSQETAMLTQWLALLHLCRIPRFTVLRRLNDVDEQLLASPMLERLLLLRQGAGLQGELAAPDRRVMGWMAPTPVFPPRPSAPMLLPKQLSASACEDLRSCPYRFFVLRVLRLGGADELEPTVQKRDYGNWLHAVLKQFHTERKTPQTLEQGCQMLRQIGRDTAQTQGWPEADFLPYWASFERLLVPYLEWTAQREKNALTWLDGEQIVQASPAEWAGVTMHGVIDRLDRVSVQPPTLQLVDYKTASALSLRQKLASASEETQLAFYAALMLSHAPTESLQAVYVALDEGRQIKEVPHPDVHHHAQLLIEGIGHDLARLRKGAPLWPLGQGKACEHCQARGLCRRDQWAQPVAQPAPLEPPW